MKIAHFFDFFSPRGGGTIDLLVKLTRALAQRGHEVTIFTSDYMLDDGLVSSLPEVTVRPFHCKINIANYYYAPGLDKALGESLVSYDLAHLHCFRSYQNIVVRRHAAKQGVPYILDTHGSLPRRIPGEADPKAALRWLFDLAFGRDILRDATRVVAETHVGISEYKQFGVKEDKISLIPPPFDTGAFSVLPPKGQFRSRYGLNGQHVVMFLGRIHRIKGLDFLAAGFAELSRSDPDALLVIVGNDDGYKSTLQNLSNRLGIGDRVLYTGFLAGEEKLAALVDADAVVQTSKYEQGAWAPFEAVLSGTPIIVSDNSGAGEDVKRIDAGYLVEYGNTSDLAQKMAHVLAKPGEARKRTEKAKRYIEKNLSMESGIIKYETLYEEVVRRQAK